MPQSLDPARLSFRPLALADLPLLHPWFNAPHAKRWWAQRGTAENIRAEYTPYITGEIPIHAYIIEYAERAIGLFSWERFGDFPDLMRDYEVTDENAMNCDVIVGEEDFAHKGLGRTLILRFLHEIAFADARITTCLIDPERDNAIAIRAYEKAGFRHVRNVKDDEGAAIHLMELTRAELFAST